MAATEVKITADTKEARTELAKLKKALDIPGAPKDDGKTSRKFLTAVIGCGVAWMAATTFLGFALVGFNETCAAPAPGAALQCVGGATAAAKSLGFTAELWSNLTKWLVGFAVVGYSSANLVERFLATRNGSKKKPAS